MLKKFLVYTAIYLFILLILTAISIYNPINEYINANINNINSINDILFSTIGIIFSVGFSILLGFDLYSIKNEKSFKDISNKLKNTKNYTLRIFILSLITYILSKIIPNYSFVFINRIYIFQLIFISFLSFFIILLSINFSVLYDEKSRTIEEILKQEKENNDFASKHTK
ncbi:hypothetical protein [uncultured Brachyspira sp.]|uniref:hypothetical protein n=1 Tax=uncultured Brachyspira sp. TaxID=221953 RepID=UPI0027DC87D1|nr:hypothetical protein [uncultured Brachyspira sp.]